MTQPTKSDPGVQMTRRLALRGACAAPALFGLARLGRAASGVESGEIDDLLRRWTDKTAELVSADEPNEDAYLAELCAELASIDPTALPRRVDSFQKDGMTSGPAFNAMPFLVIQFDLEPGAIIRGHNHVGWDFLSLGVRGEVLVQNFEHGREAPAPNELQKEFELREVSSQLLTRGRTSTLSRTRSNIHAFRAGDDGATFYDFGANLGRPGDGPTIFSVLEIDETPRDRERRTYSARWIGNPYK